MTTDRAASGACHIEHCIGFTGLPLGRNTEHGPWEPCADVAGAKEACERARWPEHHRDDCAWCALVGEERALRESLLNDPDDRSNWDAFHEWLAAQ